MGEMGNAYKILVRERDGKRPLRRPKPRWENTTKIDVIVIGRMWTGFI
jgi:hypothetical protein